VRQWTTLATGANDVENGAEYLWHQPLAGRPPSFAGGMSGQGSPVRGPKDCCDTGGEMGS
jgi:hypothetical protein